MDAVMVRARELLVEDMPDIYASFKDEAKKGSLAVGKLADLTVLDRDLTAIDPTQIADTQVLATMVGGCFEFDHVGFTP